MRLQRSTSEDGRGKYAIVDNRTGEIIESVVDSPEEFFVLKLKDRHAAAALIAYAESIAKSDPQFAMDVMILAKRSIRHPQRKEPD